MKGIVLSVRQWDYVQKDSGKRVVGASMVFTLGDAVAQEDGSGVQLMETRLEPELAATIQAPAVVELDFSVSPNPFRRGEMETKVVAAKPVQRVDLARFLTNPVTGELAGKAA